MPSSLSDKLPALMAFLEDIYSLFTVTVLFSIVLSLFKKGRGGLPQGSPLNMTQHYKLQHQHCVSGSSAPCEGAAEDHIQIFSVDSASDSSVHIGTIGCFISVNSVQENPTLSVSMNLPHSQ